MNSSEMNIFIILIRLNIYIVFIHKERKPFTIHIPSQLSLSPPSIRTIVLKQFIKKHYVLPFETFFFNWCLFLVVCRHGGQVPRGSQLINQLRHLLRHWLPVQSRAVPYATYQEVSTALPAPSSEQSCTLCYISRG